MVLIKLISVKVDNSWNIVVKNMLVYRVILWLMLDIFFVKWLIICLIGFVWKNFMGVFSIVFNMLLCIFCVVVRFDSIS